MGNIVDHPSVPLDSAKPVQTKPGEDRISELPDEIIQVILSRLRLRDAIRTKVLSRRWRHMWEYTAGILDFGFSFYYELKSWERNDLEFKRVRKVRFIREVNTLLNAHKALTIETFDVSHDLDFRHKSDIDSWIEFALEKKVRKLKLDLWQQRNSVFPDYFGSYQFPVLDKSKLSCLRSISFYGVEFTDEVLNYLLSNCPFLESASVDTVLGSTGFHLAPCPNLKHLEIGTSYHVPFLDISSAPNLTSFVYIGSGYTTILGIKNVPNLTHVSLARWSFDYTAVVYNSRELPSFLFQIKELTLEVSAFICSKSYSERPRFPELKNVNELKLTHTDIFSCVPLMKACPNCYKFSVKHILSTYESKRWGINKSMKVVEFEEFIGKNRELEFYKRMLSSAPSLEKIIVDISQVNNDRKKSKFEKSVRRLTLKISPSAKLSVILSRRLE